MPAEDIWSKAPQAKSVTSPTAQAMARTVFALALDGAYDVLIVDRMLPKRDGLSVINELHVRAASRRRC